MKTATGKKIKKYDVIIVGAGVSRGLIQASASGVIAANAILKRYRVPAKTA